MLNKFLQKFRDKAFLEANVKKGLVIYSFLIIALITLVQFVLLGTDKSTASTIIDSQGIWCRGGIEDPIPGYANLAVGNCVVPSNEYDDFNFDKCENNTQYGEVTACASGFGPDGLCKNGSAPETLEAFNTGEVKSCTEVANRTCKSVKLNVQCSASGPTDYQADLGSVTCDPDPQICQDKVAEVASFKGDNLNVSSNANKADGFFEGGFYIPNTYLSCSGQCNSGASCNALTTTYGEYAPDGYMWGCYQRNGSYQCLGYPKNATAPGLGGCFLSCSGGGTWQDCGCGPKDCTGKPPGTYYGTCANCGQYYFYTCEATPTTPPVTTPPITTPPITTPPITTPPVTTPPVTTPPAQCPYAPVNVEFWVQDPEWVGNWRDGSYLTQWLATHPRSQINNLWINCFAQGGGILLPGAVTTFTGPNGTIATGGAELRNVSFNLVPGQYTARCYTTQFPSDLQCQNTDSFTYNTVTTPTPTLTVTPTYTPQPPACLGVTGQMPQNTVVTATQQLDFRMQASGQQLSNLEVCFHGNFEGPGWGSGWKCLRDISPSDGNYPSNQSAPPPGSHNPPGSDFLINGGLFSYNQVKAALVQSGHDPEDIDRYGITWAANTFHTNNTYICFADGRYRLPNGTIIPNGCQVAPSCMGNFGLAGVTTQPTPTPTVTVTPSASVTPTTSYQLVPISGRVVCQDNSNTPEYAIDGARVYIYDQNGMPRMVTTDRNGNYSTLVPLTSENTEIGVMLLDFDPNNDQRIDQTGQSYANMAPPPAAPDFARNCSDTSVTNCNVRSGLNSCGPFSMSGSSSYTNCGIGPSIVGDYYSKFDFRFRNCAVVPTSTPTPTPSIPLPSTPVPTRPPVCGMTCNPQAPVPCSEPGNVCTYWQNTGTHVCMIPFCANNPGTCGSDVCRIPAPDIEVSKRVVLDADSTYNVGETVTFRITIKNNGDSPMRVVSFADTYNQRYLDFTKIINVKTGTDITLEFNEEGTISESLGTLEHPDLTIINDIGDLQPGATIELDIVFKALSKVTLTCNEVLARDETNKEEILTDEAMACVIIKDKIPVTDL